MAEEKEQQELLNTSEETKPAEKVEKAPKKEAKKPAPKKKHNKRFHQETFKTKSGDEILFTFPGVREAEQLNNQAKGSGTVVILSNLHELYMTNIFEGNEYGWEYYDAKIPTADRTRTVKIKDFDDNETTYKFKLPSLERIEDIAQVTQDGTDGERLSSELMDDVVTDSKGDKLDWDYWDEHLGYGEVMSSAWLFCFTTYRNSEYAEAIEACSKFVNKMFR